MNQFEDYDKEVAAIRAYNQPVFDAFQGWLQASGLTAKTIKKHLDNIDFFTDYLTYYEPLCRLDEADEGDVASFLMDWYPRKAMWASVSSTKSYLASFRKFFKFMGQTGRLADDRVAEILDTLKQQREDFLAAIEDDEEDDWW